MTENRKTPKLRFKGFTDAWEQRKLGGLAEKIYGGGTPTTSSEAYWNGDIPWIQSSDIVEEKLFGVEARKHITQEGLNHSAAQLVPMNSIAIVTRVGVGKLAFMTYSYATSQDFLSLSQINVEPFFAIYACYKKLQSDLNAVQGTSIKGITKDELLSKAIMVPQYAEQQQIGIVFRSLDNLITLHQRKLDRLKNIKKSMLDKMFPKDGEVVPEIRFKGFTDAWEQRKLSEVLSSYTDPVEIPRTGYERLGIRSHAKGTFHNFVPAGHELQTAQMHRVAADKFIVNITFGWEHAVAVTDENDAGKLVSHRFPQFSLSEELDPKFLKFIILDEDFRHHLWLASPGGAGRNRVLNINEMLQYEIMIPNVPEQRKIARMLIDLDNLITLHQRKLDKLKNIKKSMLDNMFV